MSVKVPAVLATAVAAKVEVLLAAKHSGRKLYDMRAAARKGVSNINKNILICACSVAIMLVEGDE